MVDSGGFCGLLIVVAIRPDNHEWLAFQMLYHFESDQSGNAIGLPACQDQTAFDQPALRRRKPFFARAPAQAATSPSDANPPL
jgi:hypothetical protein